MTYAFESTFESRTSYENVRASVEACLSTSAVQEHLQEMATKAALMFADAQDTIARIKEQPKRAVATIVGAAAVAATMKLSDGRQVGDATEHKQPDIATTLTVEQVDTIADSYTSMPVTTKNRYSALPIDAAPAIPWTASTTKVTQANHTAEISNQPPTKPPKKLRDIIPPIKLPAKPQQPVIEKEKAPALTFSLYKIKPGDTLSDITNDVVFKRLVNPYKTDDAGITHFSDEFISAARDIAIENLAVGSMRPPELTTEGNPIGLTQTYTTNNENMTQQQQVHEFVFKINMVLTSYPGDREALRALFDDEITPELIPHVLRYLAVGDNVYLPNYDLRDFGVTTEENGKNSHKYFNEFGGRIQRHTSY